MKASSLGYVPALAACLFVFACSAPPSPAPETGPTTAIKGAKHDRTGQRLFITTHVYKNLGALNAARFEWHKKNGSEPASWGEALGWSVWSPEDKVCDIHIVRIRSVDDGDAMETAGHELAHCLYGGFHQE